MLGDYRFKGIAPRMTEQQFWDELRLKRSPVPEADARTVYRYAVARQTSPEALLGMFWKESRYGTDPAAICVNDNDGQGPTRSWGNTTTPAYGAADLGKPYIRGRFTRFRTWADGGISTVARLWEHAPYVGKLTVREIVPIWAPPSENATAAYIASVLETTERLLNAAPLPYTPTAGPWVAVAAGHHNQDGGNADERITTGRMAGSVMQALARLGLQAWTPIPDGPDADSLPGDGMYPGGIWDVADAVVAENIRKPFKVFVELHTQGVGNPNVRGVFGIYPDRPDLGDVDTDAATKLIPIMVGKFAQYTHIPIWSDGVMSERETGVGLDGFRLGIFNRTAPIKDSCTRLIIEMGAHSNPQDYAIQRTDAFYEAGARAIAESIADFLGWQGEASVSPIYQWWEDLWRTA